jgi:23S rRNA (cytosine1962-C5)-methyltransferase
MLAKLRLKAHTPARVLAGHPWAFMGEILTGVNLPPDGSCVELTDIRGYSAGSGLWNSKSQISWRRYSRRPELLDGPVLENLLRASVLRRGEKRVGRLVWSEADSLPGLIVDRYGDYLSVQALTLGMDQRLPQVLQALQAILNPREIVLRNDASSRKLEGLDQYIKTVSGNPLQPFWLEVGKVQMYIDLLSGQKTGLYLDQIEQHQNVARYAAGRTVLDAFCNQGGFGLACAQAGAKSVLGLDSSTEAIDAARRGALHNGLSARFEVANVFDWFTENREQSFDLIILDPPPFARKKEDVKAALRGYKELNLRAMKLLNKGGILATYSCSHRISDGMVLSVLESAASDAHRDAFILERTFQPADHPVLVNFPESLYLKGFILEMR